LGTFGDNGVTIPIKKSSFLGFIDEKLRNYVIDLDNDLKQLYSQFRKLISFNSVKVGTSDNYTQISGDGTITLGGTATTFTDYNVPLLTTKPTAAGKPDYDYTYDSYMFPNNDTSENLRARVQLPHQWKIGSTIQPHVHWVQQRNQNCVFRIDYVWFSNGADISATLTNWATYTMSTTIFTYATGTISQISYNPVGIDGTGRGISSVLKVRLYRDDAVYTGDAIVDDFDIHYEIDSLGSSQEYSK